MRPIFPGVWLKYWRAVWISQLSVGYKKECILHNLLKLYKMIALHKHNIEIKTKTSVLFNSICRSWTIKRFDDSLPVK